MWHESFSAPNKRHSTEIVAEGRVKDYAAALSVAIQLMCQVLSLSQEISFGGMQPLLAGSEALQRIVSIYPLAEWSSLILSQPFRCSAD